MCWARSSKAPRPRRCSRRRHGRERVRMSNGDTTRWWWVRHAPVIVNKGCCYGQTDLPCDIADTARFTSLANRLPKAAVWVATPLKRTHMTASALVEDGL